MKKKALIVGAGIAGVTCAYWLQKKGYVVEIVEKAPSKRTQGYLMDFWGAGFNVLEKMGLADSLIKLQKKLNEFVFVDAFGEIESSLSIEKLRYFLNNRVVTISRKDLLEMLTNALVGINIYYETVCEQIVSKEDKVVVTFSNGNIATYDLLVGADGVNSQIRQLFFNDEKNSFVKPLGYKFTTAIHDFNFPLEKSLYTYAMPNKQVTICHFSEGKAASYFVYRDNNTSDAMLENIYEDAGWIIPALLKNVKVAKDVYTGSMTQVMMPSWHKKNVVLLGDACCCMSLASGQGASMAVAGAYILADCISRYSNDVSLAFLEYETLMQSSIEKKQLDSKKFLFDFVPADSNLVEKRNFYTRYFFKAIHQRTDIERFCE